MTSFICCLMQLETPLELGALSLFLEKGDKFIDSFGALPGFD